MSLSSSMWSGVSGLLAHGEKMNVLGNNIANLNTVGFKGQTMHFEDFIYQYTSTTGFSQGQVGRGVAVAAVYGDFSQGAFETTNESTDLAISGKGFFGVKPKTQDTTLYTRAGNFRFDKDGYLVDPHGYPLQGWEIQQTTASAASTTTSSTTTSTSQIRGVGVPKDVQLQGFTCDPKHTTRTTMITNLDPATGGDNTPSATNPFFALAASWNGQNDPPIGSTAFAYSSTIKVYDEAGVPHNLTTYYDRASNTADTNTWEYIVTSEPAEDNRIFGSGYRPGLGSGAGLMMVGTLTFNSSGQLNDISAYTLPGGATNAKDLSQWRTTAISQDGYPMFAADFTGLSNASWVVNGASQPIVPTLSNARGKLIEMNFGISATPTATWTNNNVPSAVGADPTRLPGFGVNAERAVRSSTSYAGSSSTIFQSQDGYTSGFLQNINVDRDGILKGRYSNGVTLELYQITLYDFASYVGLRREGGNLFSQTLESGEAFPGPANGNGLGSIASNSLEQSNVDLAREFVQMITTQRGFSANGKVITTTDQMLSEVIMLKR